jgi:hypothetical protein
MLRFVSAGRKRGRENAKKQDQIDGGKKRVGIRSI